MRSHFVEKCRCGVVVAQCRCPSLTKTVRVSKELCPQCKAEQAARA